MKKFNCPSCGGEIIFQSNVSIYAICGYCSSVVVRHDVNVESIGTMASLPEDMSPLMLGSEGIYRGNKFHIIGRIKMGWAQGTWNEWHILMQNGGKGWVAEAQGFLAINFDYAEPLLAETQKTLAKLGKPKNEAPANNQPTFALEAKADKTILGNHLFFNQLKYKVVDIKEAVCLGGEGELPHHIYPNKKIISVDLLGHQGEFASIEITHDATRIYVGHYLDWPEFNWNNLRPLEGW